MKKLILTIISFTILTNAWTQPLETLFDEANSTFKSGNTKKAIEKYKELLETKKSANTLYNLGNAYYQNKETGYAILSYLQALTLDPKHPEALANLKFVRTTENIQPPKENTLHQIARNFSLNTWAWTATITFWILAAFFTLRKTFSWHGIVHHSITAIALITFCLSLIGLFGYHIEKDTGVILARETPLTVAPTEQSPINAFLFAGTLAKEIKHHENFLFIKTDNGKEGWIQKSAYQKIIN